MSAEDVTEIRVDTKYSDVIIEQSTHLPTGDLASRVIRLQDDGIRDALVSLGWLPPHEAAALRRQVEEQRVVVPEFDVNKLDGLEGAWAEGNLRVYIAGARAGWGKCASLIRIPPGDVVATPPPDVVTVPREELALLREIERYARIQLPGTTLALRDIDALRSGEAPAQRGEG